MRRGVVIAFAVLGLAACGQKENQSATSASDATPQSAAESAAKPDVGAAANPDATSCLDLVATGSYEAAVPVCTAALGADPNNTQVKAALDTANSKIAEMAAAAAQGAADAAAGAADAAQDAADTAEDAADAAKEAAPAPKY
ncbi:MAG TPA: hypothetical protein VKF60_04285 [Myxococcota bacterium]|nr:hypothetical protein [Myxococcota bacterium]